MSPVRRPPRRRRPDGLQHGRGVAAGVPSRRSNWTAGCSLNFEARLHQLLGAIPYLEGGLSNLRLPVLNAHAVPSLPSKGTVPRVAVLAPVRIDSDDLDLHVLADGGSVQIPPEADARQSIVELADLKAAAVDSPARLHQLVAGRDGFAGLFLGLHLGRVNARLEQARAGHALGVRCTHKQQAE